MLALCVFVESNVSAVSGKNPPGKNPREGSGVGLG